MRAYVVVAWVAWVLCSLGAAAAEPAHVNPDNLDNLYSTLHAPNASELPRQLQTDVGFLRFIGAPPGSYFANRVSIGKGASPEDAAQAFAADHGGAFSTTSERMGLVTERANSEDDRNYVRLQQTYNGLTVFGAQMLVQMNPFGGVQCVLSHMLRDMTPLDTNAIPITPSVTVDAAETNALAWVALQHTIDVANLSADEGQRMLYDPGVMNQKGAVSLVWVFKVSGVSADRRPVGETVFVDAQTGVIVFHYSLIEEAKNRSIWDAGNFFDYDVVFDPVTGDYSYVLRQLLVRTEGSAPTGLVDADQAYQYLGDTYDFYKRVHNRDSLDGKGLPLKATVMRNRSFS